MEEIVTNPHRHISSDLVEQIVSLGKSVSVDKRRTGNAMSTAVSNLPKTINVPDVLIVPNINTAKDKHDNHKSKGRFAKGKNVLFFYSGSGQLALKDYSNVDLIVCVADSYLYKEIDEIETRYIFLDENHTGFIQSALRVNLYWLYEKLKHKENVVYFTATPYQNVPVDIVINNTHNYHKKLKDVYVSNCYERSLKELKRCLRELAPGERILIASNEARKVNNILKQIGVSEVRLMSGSNFRKSFFKHNDVEVNDTASITIMTTSAFEGHDVMEENTSVFVFQNYANKIVQFLDPQIIQAFGRPRKNPKYLHINWGGGGGLPYSNTIVNYQDHLEEIGDAYCRLFNKKQQRQLEKGNNKSEKQSYEGDNFLISYKGNKIKLGDMRGFIVYDDSIFNLEKKRIAKVNYMACDVLRSKINIYKDGLNKEYFKGRGYRIISYDDKPYNIKLKGITNIEKIQNLLHNRIINPEYISKGEVVKWGFDFDKKTDFIKVYRILKLHFQDDMPSHIDYFFNSFKDFGSVTDVIYKGEVNRYKESKESSKDMPDEEIVKENTFLIIKSFLTWRKPAKKIRAFRDYNVFAVTSNRMQDHIASLFNLRCWRPDISACASTIVQALANDQKRSVYDTGENRESSKLKINSALFSIYKDGSEKERKYSERLMRDVIKPTFSDKTYLYLKDKYYKTGISNLLSNVTTYHEREIIRRAIKLVEKERGNNLITTKHDQMIVFFKDISDEDFERLTYQYEEMLSNQVYLGFNNWFGFIPKNEVGNEVENEVKILPVLSQISSNL